jgi:hypothetical protein
MADKSKPEMCGKIVLAGFGIFYPCACLRPCPIHGTKPSNPDLSATASAESSA